MIAELGHFALILAFVLALVQGSLPLAGAHRHTVGRDDGGWIALAGPAALGQFVFIALAFAALTALFVGADFSVMVVAANANSQLPLIYKISAVWGHHEGSMVLWVLILALFGLCVAVFGSNLPATFRARALGVQGRTQRAQAASTRPSISAAMAKEKAIEKPT